MATITTPRPQSPAPGTPRIKSPSIADTPTSSTCGSIDLNPRPYPQAAPPRRNRTALRDYYNLKSKSGAPGAGPAPGTLSRTASITSTTSDVSTAASIATLTDHTSTTSSLTAQLDSTDFDAEAYISSLLASSGLREILRVEATLVSEIRNLDGERKALVYDNYSKLIKAVGTIGEMQRGMNDGDTGGLREVGELETKMEGLRASVLEIAGKRRPDEDKYARDRWRKAKDAEKKKEVVRWVVAAPVRLRRLMEEGRKEDADREWGLVRRYLNKWDGVKGVEDVRRRCEDVMGRSEQNDEGQENSDSGQD